MKDKGFKSVCSARITADIQLIHIQNGADARYGLLSNGDTRSTELTQGGWRDQSDQKAENCQNNENFKECETVVVPVLAGVRM